MSGHDELASPLDARLEGHHLAIHHLCPCLLGRCVAEMCVGLCVAVAGEVLDTACDTRIFQALQIVSHHPGSHLGLVAESALTDDDVLGIGVHVGHWREVDIEAVMLQIGADGVATLIGILRVACRTDGGHRFIFLDVEVGVVSKS